MPSKHVSVYASTITLPFREVNNHECAQHRPVIFCQFVDTDEVKITSKHERVQNFRKNLMARRFNERKQVKNANRWESGAKREMHVIRLISTTTELWLRITSACARLLALAEVIEHNPTSTRQKRTETLRERRSSRKTKTKPLHTP